jgi:hypothetical protein
MSPLNGVSEFCKLILNSRLHLSSKTLLCRGRHLALGRIHCNAVNSGLVSWIDKIQSAFKS